MKKVIKTKKVDEIKQKDLEIKELKHKNANCENETGLCVSLIIGLVVIALAIMCFTMSENYEAPNFDEDAWCLNKVGEFYPEYDIINVHYYYNACVVKTATTRRNGFVEASESKILSIINESELDYVHKQLSKDENKSFLHGLGWAISVIAAIIILIGFIEYFSTKNFNTKKVKNEVKK